MWGVAVRLSYILDAWCLKVNTASVMVFSLSDRLDTHRTVTYKEYYTTCCINTI